MIKFNHELLGTPEGLEGVMRGGPSPVMHTKKHHEIKRDHQTTGIPTAMLAPLHTLVGCIEGYFGQMIEVPFRCWIVCEATPGLAVLEGEATFFRVSDGHIVQKLAQMIDSAAYMIAHGCLGNFKVRIEFNQTCEMRMVE